MPAFTLIQISDTHLSRSHAYFQDNWEVCVELINSEASDLVVHTGDVAFNAPDVEDDLDFALEQMSRLHCEWLIVPGNHDIGEPGEHTRLNQYVSEQSVQSWLHRFGADHFCRDIPGWRLLGLNSEILGSGLSAEAAQWAFLGHALEDLGDRRVALFLHKSLFVDDPEATTKDGACVHPAPRQRLLDALAGVDLGVVACGHHHAYHHSRFANADIVWAPTTAFVKPFQTWPVPATNRSGLIRWSFDRQSVSHEFIEPPMLANIDLTNWTNHSGTTITLPPRPLPEA